ncbi:MAG: L-2-hydroxyglutarate oxidase [Pseudobacteriovorax sp.]|nr:L-2-hydroxyglutarate oxidase [Pseudobacteriovorax sp.]
MKHQTSSADTLIVGGGIVALTLAFKLKKLRPNGSITVLEKEKDLGKHGSGRNSGVLHTGLYYSKGSLKALLCSSGSRQMKLYCKDRGIRVSEVGKILVPTTKIELEQLPILKERAIANKAEAHIISSREALDIEPLVNPNVDQVLHCPQSAVVNPKDILLSLSNDLKEMGIEVCTGEAAIGIDPVKRVCRTDQRSIEYGRLINCAGMFADKIAEKFDIGGDYAIAPFKGNYLKLTEDMANCINGHIYPIPNIEMPFLGVHFTKTIDQNVYLGPNAFPAMGRENYSGLKGAELSTMMPLASLLTRQYVTDSQGFRKHMHRELKSLSLNNQLKAIQAMVPKVEKKHLVSATKVGIRPQLYNKKTKKLEMDFVVKRSDHSVHILNAISPAFTCSMAFADYIIEEYIDDNSSNKTLQSSGNRNVETETEVR